MTRVLGVHRLRRTTGRPRGVRWGRALHRDRSTITGMRHPDRPRGYTLIELAVIVVVVAILAAISLVAVTAARARNERAIAAQSVASVSAAQFDFADAYGTYSDWPADLELPDGPEVVGEPSVAPEVVSVAMAEDGTIGLAAGTGSDCVLRSITSMLNGADITDRTVGDNIECIGASALPAGSRRAVPESRLPR